MIDCRERYWKFSQSHLKKNIRVSIKRGKGKTSKSRRKKFEESKLDIYVWQTLQEMLIESTAISFYNQSCQFLCKHRESVLEQICTRNLHKITANLTLSFQSSNLMVLCGSSFPNESCFLMKDCFERVHDFFNSMWFLVSKLIVWLLGIDIFMKCNFSRFTDESFSAAIFKDNFDSEFQH